ncbi:MAG: hypothetical protein DRG39_04860 [Deltaproteobacteria bacterium]|nr:MAG: hypothetical protein DRG39_04860 [Deltaproteobacteria bacterium]
MGAILTLKDIFFSYNSRTVLKNINMDILEGQVIGILGPNGSGKSTLLKLMDGILIPEKGKVLLKGKPIDKYNRIDIAREIAMVGQEDHFRFPFSVSEVVLMGRFPYTSSYRFENKRDLEVAHNALKLTNTLHLAKRSIHEISGGERQRVFLARAIAQEPSIILLDEITSFLDIRFKREILMLLASLKNKGISMVIASHDIELMARYCEKMVLLKDGDIYAMGRPDQVLTEENISHVYECPVHVDKDPVDLNIRITIK